jgi:hypothetical protein
MIYEREKAVLKKAFLELLCIIPPNDRAVFFEEWAAQMRTELSKRDTQPVRMPDILGKDGAR